MKRWEKLDGDGILQITLIMTFVQRVSVIFEQRIPPFTACVRIVFGKK